MKIRSIEALQQHIQESSAWRKHELHELNGLVARQQDRGHRLLLRASIALTYAHWEGYTREAIEAVLHFVRTKGLRGAELNEAVLALSVKGRLGELTGGSSNLSAIRIVRELREALDGKCQIPKEVSTRSNLNRSVFEDLMCGLGIDPNVIWTAQPGVTNIDLDGRLLKRRNQIAHGEHLAPDAEECAELIASVCALMDAMEETLVGYAQRQEFSVAFVAQ